MSIKHNSIRRRSPVGLIILVISATLLAGCNLPASAPTPIILPSATPLPPQNTPTSQPPTLTSTPTATATPKPGTIVFAAGATAGVVEGTLQPNEVKSYDLSAEKNQPLILLVDSPNSAVTLGVYRANGDVMVDPAKKWTQAQWLLPATEVYKIQLINNDASSVSYTLTAKVAARINFAAGATSTTLTGSTPNGYVFTYAVSAAENQTLTVTLNAPANSAYLDIFGLAFGQLLLDPADKANTWTGPLPSTQDYIIEIIPSNGQVVNYSLTVTIH
jgi:hypothetical protein